MSTKKSPFTVIRKHTIPEIHSVATLFEHTKTKAQLLSLENSDENKSFGITFRTPPPDNSGIAHILEHSVLCGSKKYPLKEPFIELVKGSLNTFLNAFTYPDKTSYPVASTNEKDFYNLVGVYLDAVFFPLLSKETLMQEGWHLHQEKETDPVEFKGIVFNEMKGAYSSPDRALWDAIQASLLPDTPYRFDSGGDPLSIPNLRYEDFIAFHKQYYHPSNALLFFSGDDAVEKRLELADAYLSQFDYQNVDSSIPLQSAFKKPVTIHAPVSIGPDDDPKKKGMVSVNWVLEESTKTESALRLRMLSHILTGSAGSPLRKALIDSGLGEDIVGGGVDSDLRQMVFSIGLKGVDIKNAKKIETLILSTLKKLVREKIEQPIIETTLNTVEFRIREQNTGSFPRGLSLLYGALTSWLYGGDPIDAFSFEKPLLRLKKDLASGKTVFEDLIQLYFLDNTHRSTVVLEPDTEWNAKREKEEQTVIASRVRSLSAQEKKAIRDQTKTLMKLQTQADSPEALQKLPKLTRSDLEKKNFLIPIHIEKEQDVEVYTHPIPTNGVVYLELGFDLSAVPEELLLYIPLFSRCLLEMGTEKESFGDFLHRQSRETGGIWTSCFSSSIVGGKGTVAKLFVHSKWLVHQKEQAKNLLLESLLHADFSNKERFLQMVLEEKAENETDILESGHHYATSAILKQLHVSDWLDEKFSGVEQLFFIRNLVSLATKDWSQVQKKLETIRNIVINRHTMLVNITADSDLLPDVHRVAKKLIAEVPLTIQKEAKWQFVPSHHNETIIVPTTVNYVAKGANLYKNGYVFDGSSLVMSRYLRTSWLWEQVRMKGGAYGAFSSFDSLSGTFTFASYRDPHLQETLNVFDHTTDFLREIHLSEEELTKAIIGQISDFDHYMLPDTKGFSSLTRHLIGLTEKRRQEIREEILSTNEADFHAFADVLETVNTNGIIAIVTNSEKAKTLPSSYQKTTI